MTATATQPAVTSTDEPIAVAFDVDGERYGLFRTPKKDDPTKHYYAFRSPNGKYTGFGLQVPATSPTLPTSVEVDGLEIPLKAGLTSATKKDKAGHETAVEQRPKASFYGTVELPTLGQRTVKIIVSVTKAGAWNVNATAMAPHSVSPEERAADAAKRAATNGDAIKAALAAIGL